MAEKKPHCKDCEKQKAKGLKHCSECEGRGADSELKKTCAVCDGWGWEWIDPERQREQKANNKAARKANEEQGKGHE